MKKLLYGWMVLHLTYIGVVNLLASYNLWQDAQQPRAPAQPLPGLLRTQAARYYGRLTGAEHGYGFFGLNVRSNGALTGECGGQKLEPTGRSFETSLRLITLANTLTDDWLAPATVPQADAPLLADYRALVVRNVAFTLHQQAGCPDTAMDLRYALLLYPSLAEARQGKPLTYALRPFLTVHYTFRPHDR
ncbi:hypothetical protein [Hymenobacter cavernae]|uniref:Uncharacterized protein n=1 Tax=Hymenobacter cavernae TaxID=2044852 RepID=A0ABQ1U0R7_9BACT|nr:hypothetical protein [Hymenobacter cavernae]GGF06307.1 hypothetical protein GCM10011383_16710 [Hymenobacter cavernae]